MKNLQLLLLSIGTMLLFTQCAEKSAETVLKDDSQRREIIASIVSHEPYRAELMDEMMSNDSCKHMMHERLKSDPAMMQMMMHDSTMMHKMMSGDKSMQIKMMDHMVDMADKDSVLFNAMITRMNSKPEMMTRMMKMPNSKMK